MISIGRFWSAPVCSYRVRGVEGSCVKHLTVESYTIIVSLQSSRAARQRQPCVKGDWLCQWEMAIFDPPQNKHPSTITKKFGTGDYVGGPYGCAKFGANPSMWGFWANG